MNGLNQDSANPQRLHAEPGIVVFTGDLSFSVRKGIVHIDRTVPDTRWLVLVHRPPKRAARMARNQWRNLRRNGWRWIPYQVGEACRLLTASQQPRRAVPQAPGEEFSLAALRRNPRVRRPLFSIPVHGTLNLHKGKVPEYRGMPPAFYVILGYPCGGRQHMTAERLDLVKQAGYTGCLSAYGGSNIGSVDPFDVRRLGTHREFFDRAFRCECRGLS